MCVGGCACVKCVCVWVVVHGEVSVCGWLCMREVCVCEWLCMREVCVCVGGCAW